MPRANLSSSSALGVLDFGYGDRRQRPPHQNPGRVEGRRRPCHAERHSDQSGEQLGATPVTITTEVFSALQTGTIQGQENPVNAICSNGFHEVQKYLSMTDHLYAPVLLAISESAWSKMSEL